MKEKNLESGFKIVHIILLESNFKRESNIIFEDKQVQQEIDVDVNVTVKENTVIVTEQVIYKQKSDDLDQVFCLVKMVGIFEKTGASKIENLEEFGNINGAAIIYPFIREHLSNLTAKAGLGLILLPPVNFTKK